MLPLWFRANSVAFRCSPCGFARIPASRGLFRPLLGGPLRLPTATARAVRRDLIVSTPPLWFCTNSVAFRCCRCGFARIPLHFDAPPVVSREFRPLVASSGLFWRGHLGCQPQRHARWNWSLVSTLLCGFARIPLRFDAPAVVSRESVSFQCSLLFRANSVAFRCSPCGFARIPASRGLFRLLLGGPLRLPTATARAVRRNLIVSTPPLWFRTNSVAFRCCRCGFARIPLHFDAPPVDSREFRPLVASSGPFWGGHLGCRPQRCAR